MKRISIFMTLLIGLTACSESQDESEISDALDETKEMVTEIVPEEVIPEMSVAEYIQGSWMKIEQDCDADGKNGKASTGADWVFDGENVSLGRIQQPYHVSHDTIYIVDSPYLISKEWGDTILLHGLAKDRYLKLVKK